MNPGGKPTGNGRANCRRPRGDSGIPHGLVTVVLHHLRLGNEDDLFGDIRGKVRNAFQIPRDPGELKRRAERFGEESRTACCSAAQALTGLRLSGSMP